MHIAATFGQVEAALAAQHGVADSKRTQFQARLRKLQRLGIPQGVSSGRGVPGRYGAGQIVELALALQFTELGITPERLHRILRSNRRGIAQAVRFAAMSVRDNPGVLAYEDKEEQLTHMFIYFDPNALRMLTSQEEEDWDWASATLYRMGAADLRDNLILLCGDSTRLSLINVTAMMSNLTVGLEQGARDVFLAEAIEWADKEELAPLPPMRLLVAEEAAEEAENQQVAASAREDLRQQITALSPDAAYALRWVANGTEGSPNPEAAQELVAAGMLIAASMFVEGDAGFATTEMGQEIGLALQSAAVSRGANDGDGQ